MALVTNQRFIAGLSVFDTYSGLNGTVVQMNLNDTATHALAPLYTGAYFVVEFSDSTTQMFTVGGNRIDHTTGDPLPGITLLTLAEKTALLGVGYPAR